MDKERKREKGFPTDEKTEKAIKKFVDSRVEMMKKEKEKK